MQSVRHPSSLARDFALLALAILSVLFIISAWVGYVTYTKHAESVARQLEQESEHIEQALAYNMENANYLLTSLGRQIILERNYDLVQIAQTLKSFDSQNGLFTIFSFINPQKQVVVSSSAGVLEKPLDVSDRAYVLHTQEDPWKMYIGEPIEGRLSGRWIIPVSMGITDYTGKFVGSLLISVDIGILAKNISSMVRRDGVDFAVISKNLSTLTQITDDEHFVERYFPLEQLKAIDFAAEPKRMLTRGNVFLGSGVFSYYRAPAVYPYVILLGYDAYNNSENVRNQLWSRLLQLLGFAIFFVLFLWIMRVRLIRPIDALSTVAGDIASGKLYAPIPQGGPEEIEKLSAQMGRISEYLTEKNRVEDELRNKMFMLKQSKEQSEAKLQSGNEFLAYVCHGLREPIQVIVNAAMAMKDQLYGPIENRKYRQSAADIHQHGNALIDQFDRLLALSKAHPQPAHTTPSSIAEAVTKVEAYLADILGAQPTIALSDNGYAPKLLVSELALFQILTNALHYALTVRPTEKAYVNVKVLTERKEPLYAVLTIGSGAPVSRTQAELLKLAERAGNPLSLRDKIPDHLSIRLAKMLMDEHRSAFWIETLEDGRSEILLFFPQNRIAQRDSA